jgi:hypothetical protein
MYTKESLGECSDEPTGKDCSVRGESCEDTRGDRWHPEAHQTAQDGLGCAITPRPVWREGGGESRGCQGALYAYGAIQRSLPRPQTAPPLAPYPAWARGAGVRSRYGLLWHSPADGYKMMARCLRSWHAAQVWMSKEYIYLLYAPPLRHVTSCCINRFRLLLDSRVVGFADVVQPNCCHPCLLESLLFHWP